MADTIETTTPAEQVAGADAGPGPVGEAAAPPAAAETQAGTEAAAPPPADYSGLSLLEGYAADDPAFADAMKLFGAEKIAPEVRHRQGYAVAGSGCRRCASAVENRMIFAVQISDGVRRKKNGGSP